MERNFASLMLDIDLKFSDCKLESFNVSHDMRSVICIGTVIISDADMRPINDVEKLLTHHNYLFCWSKDRFYSLRQQKNIVVGTASIKLAHV